MNGLAIWKGSHNPRGQKRSPWVANYLVNWMILQASPHLRKNMGCLQNDSAEKKLYSLKVFGRLGSSWKFLPLAEEQLQKPLEKDALHVSPKGHFQLRMMSMAVSGSPKRW